MTLTAKDIEHLRPMVEKAAEAGYEATRIHYAWAVSWESLPEAQRQRLCAEQGAALLAFLNFCLDGGVARNCTYSFDEGRKWKDCPALVIKLGEAK